MTDLPPPIPTSIPRPALPSMPPPLPLSIPRPVMPSIPPPPRPSIISKSKRRKLRKRRAKLRRQQQQQQQQRLQPTISKSKRRRLQKKRAKLRKQQQETKEREIKEQPINPDDVSIYLDMINDISASTREFKSIPAYDPNLPTTGRLIISSVGKNQDITINIESPNDAALIKAIIDNEIIKDNVPALFIDLYNNKDAIGARGMVYQTLKEYNKNPKPTQFIYEGVNIYYEWNNPKSKQKGIKEINTSLNVSEMPLRDQQRKPLNHMYCIDYKSTSGHCAMDWIQSDIKQLQKLGKKRRNQIYKELQEEYKRNKILTYQPFTRILEDNQVSATIYLITGAVLYESPEKNRIHYYFTISNDHIYQLPKKHNPKYTKCKTIYLSEEEYNEALRDYRKKYDMSMVEHGYFMICEYKDNTLIKPIKYTIKYENNDLEMNKILKIKGTYSTITEKFYAKSELHSATYYNTDDSKEYRYDLSKAHRSVLSNPNYLFPVSTGLEKYRKYTGERIERIYFYQVELKDKNMTPFKELFPLTTIHSEKNNKVWMYGELLLELMKTPEYKNNMIILKEFYNFRYTTGNAKIATFDNVEVCHFSGALVRLLSRTTKSITTRSDEEISELTRIYKSRGSGVYQTDTGINICDKYFNQTTGILAKMALLQYVNLNLLDIYHTAKKSNPNVKITSVLSDCIAFNSPIFETNLKTAYGINYKLENKKKHDYSTHEQFPDLEYFDEMINDKSTVPIINKNDTSWIGKYSAKISGMAGMGKSYYIKNVVIPELQKQNKTFLCSSSTIENCNMWKKDFPESTHIQTIINRNNSYSDMCAILRPYHYLIIDESSQLNMYIVNMLFKIKEFLHNKIIFIGDSNQCLNVENLDVLNSNTLNNIVDYSIELEYHEKARFTPEYYKFLCNALLLGKKSIPAMRAYILNHSLVNNEKKENSINICYTHKFGESMDNYKTIHSTQGKTIEKVFNVYELYKIPDYRIIYTAISRARDFKYIRIVS